MTKRIEDEVPELAGRDYVRMLVEVHRCLVCKLPMRPNIGAHDPKYVEVTSEAQWRRAGWPEQGPYIASKSKWLCKPCADAGKATWKCSLCKQERVGEPQEFIGDPPENLSKSATRRSQRRHGMRLARS